MLFIPQFFSSLTGRGVICCIIWRNYKTSTPNVHKHFAATRCHVTCSQLHQSVISSLNFSFGFSLGLSFSLITWPCFSGLTDRRHMYWNVASLKICNFWETWTRLVQNFGIYSNRLSKWIPIYFLSILYHLTTSQLYPLTTGSWAWGWSPVS